MMKTRLTAFLLVLLPLAAKAHTMGKEKFTCPIDGAKWEQMMDRSGTQFGMRLDLKPLGPTAAPWAIPQCPECKFVIFEEKPAPETIAKLKPYILSEAYQTAVKGQPSYHALALIETFLGKDPLMIGHAYLKASWQTEDEPEKSRKNLELARAEFRKALPGLKPEDESFATTAILGVELDRRTGQFAEAKKQAEELSKLEVFKAEHLQEVLKREIKFSEAKDAAPHAATAEAEKYLKE